VADFDYRALQRCAERELRQRHYVYPRLVAGGRMTADKAAKETAMMSAIVDHFKALADAEEQTGRML
jgi:hypothetical protein